MRARASVRGMVAAWGFVLVGSTPAGAQEADHAAWRRVQQAYSAARAQQEIALVAAEGSASGRVWQVAFESYLENMGKILEGSRATALRHSRSVEGCVERFPGVPQRASGGEFWANLMGMRLRWIPPGSFLMGSPDSEAHRVSDEGPLHEVRFQRGFWMGEAEVTQGEFQQLLGTNPSDHQFPDHPVNQVQWQEAREFCQMLTALEQRVKWLPETWAYRLPSESEWEYAVRAGSQAPSYGPAKDVAWASDDSFGKPHPVRQKLPNAWGLHDMLGNAWEWTLDPWHDSYAGAPQDGSVWETDGHPNWRVFRGGTWAYGSEHCRAARRGRDDGVSRGNHYGFRVVLAPLVP